eukprot:3534692-Rhodomonas_salina.1
MCIRDRSNAARLQVCFLSLLCIPSSHHFITFPSLHPIPTQQLSPRADCGGGRRTRGLCSWLSRLLPAHAPGNLRGNAVRAGGSF